MTDMIELNLADSGKVHIKDEVQHIKSMYRGELLKIQYSDDGTADRKAEQIRRKMAGTQYPVNVKAVGNVVFVVRQ